MDFLWIFGCFESVSSMFFYEVITNLNLTNLFYQRLPLDVDMYHRIVSFASKKSIG
jgi:hypothetical protein